ACPACRSPITWRGAGAGTGAGCVEDWASFEARSTGSATWAAPRSPKPSTDTCAPPRTTSTDTGWVALEADLVRRPLLDAGLHIIQKPRSRQAVDDAMVERHRQVHERTNRDRVPDDPRPPADRLRPQDRGLGLVADGLPRDRTGAAGGVAGGW